MKWRGRAGLQGDSGNGERALAAEGEDRGPQQGSQAGRKG